MPKPKVDRTLTIDRVLGNLNTNLPGMNINGNYTVPRTDEERKLLHASAVELKRRRRAKRVEDFNNRSEVIKIRDVTHPEEEEDRYEGYEKPSVIGMSGYDPLLGMWPETVATFGGAGTLFKTGLWNLAKRVPTSQLGNYGRLYFVGNAFKNSFNGTIPTLISLLASKNLFRTKVYKGGEIKDPYSNFLTTDPKYAANYGKVTPYIFESKSVAKAKEPMMGSSDPVTMDMFVYNNTKRNPNATAIIGHDAVTGEFTPSKGIEILNMNPKNLYPVRTLDSSTSLKFFEKKPSTTIQISPEELYKIFKDQELNGYYFMGHGTGRTNVNSLVIFDNGLRIKNGDIGNTTSPISLSSLSLWPHANSKEIIILPGRVENVKFDSAHGRIPSDWYNDKTFKWDDNPGFEGSGFFAVLKPNATFIETEINGVPGVYTKPEAILGSYNIDTQTLKLNPRSLYNFFKKQGGKMNILELLKNGSGIKIKPSHKGLFTDYCGGKVTSECIAKGKNSSNPAIRKRATFAANARKWKHQDGGKMIKKAEEGAKFNTGLFLLNTAGLLYNGIKNANNSIKFNESLDAGVKSIKSNINMNEVKRKSEEVLNNWRELNPDVHYSDIDLALIQLKFINDLMLSNELEAQKWRALLLAKYNNSMNAIKGDKGFNLENVFETLSPLLSKYLGNTTSTTETTV